MENYNKISNTIYIPESHKKYDVLPFHRKYNMEMFVWDNRLLDKIKKLTNMDDHTTYPYYHYKSYNDFLDEIENWISNFPNAKQEILEYKNSVIKMNNKDLWAIVQYIGESNWGFTKNKYYYYVVMYIENNSWIIWGIIDNEEYSAFLVWDPKCTNPVNLIKDLKIVMDPSHNLEKEFARIMENIN